MLERALSITREATLAEVEGMIIDGLRAIDFKDLAVRNRASYGFLLDGTLVASKLVPIPFTVLVCLPSKCVTGDLVRQLRRHMSCSAGLILAPGGANQDARDEARRPNASPVVLLDERQVATLLLDHVLTVDEPPLAFEEFENIDVFTIIDDDSDPDKIAHSADSTSVER